MRKLLRVPVALRHWLLPALLLSAATAARAQNNVGIGTTTPDASAVLDASSTTQGMLVPRMTAAQRAAVKDPSTNKPATGLLVYQTDAPAGFYVYNGTAWTALSGAGSTGPAGADGKNSLVRTTAEAAGANCATGGFKTEYGLDANANGTLDAAEVNAALTRYVCNGAQGTAGSTGATGPAGQGVPTGGTAGQVLSKVDATDYNTQWTTPAAGGGNGSLQLFANKIGGVGETLPVAGSTTAATIAFNNVVSAPNNGNTWTGNNTFTVGTGQGSVYMIQVKLRGPDNATPTNTVPYNLTIQVNGASYAGPPSGSNLYGNYPSLSTATPAGLKARGEIVNFVRLNAGDNIKILATGANSTTVAPNPNADDSCNITILKMF